MNLQPLAPYLGVAEIILAVVMTILVLMQTKGADLGGFLGGGGDIGGGFRTRRGVEATMHKITIACAIAFFVCTILAFLAFGQSV
ncbi:MAG: preprotein translocase subunit SecG [Chloroflexi bacterium]|nr:preprotein translocase subunit SecG [Chloroflexota bacterium]